MRPAAAFAFAGAFAAAALAAAPAWSAPVPDRFPLGVSAGSGAVCEAVRDDDDPAAQMRGGRAWSVRCRGWDASLGHVYAYDWRGASAVGPDGAWTRALAKRASCADAQAADVKGLPKARRAACELAGAKVAYAALWSPKGDRGFAADGFASLSDVLQTGLGVVAGVQRPPAATAQASAGASSSAGSDGGLAAAAAAASASPENLRERGYTRNIAWRFTDAGTDFSALALNPAAPRTARAEGFLNWALNTSNEGRFNRADALFNQGRALIDGDPALTALYTSYQALHLRNQRRFEEAVTAAETAKRQLASLTPGSVGGQAATLKSGGASSDIVIDAQLASALRSRTAFTLSDLDPAARVKVQLAQLELTEATALSAINRPEQARAALERARVILSQPGLAQVAVWLRVQLETELARQEQVAGRAASARTRLAAALQQLRARQAGSSAEAYLTLELARADAVANDQEAALREFGRAVELFRSARGAIGASADAVDVYFNLLLSRIASDPDHVDAYAEKFLEAAESLGSEATADTVARLSARLNQSGGASAGLIRALEDTRRQVRLKEAEVSQSRPDRSAAEAAAQQAELKTLTAQAAELEAKVAAADPRYGQLVTTTVSLADLQKTLRPGEIFVKTVLLDQTGYGIAIGPHLAVPYRIEATRADLEKLVVKLRTPFETEGRLPAYDVASSQAFFTAVFGAVRETVLGAKHIIYEPDPVTLGLPVGALATDSADADLIAKRRAAIRAKGEGVLSYGGVRWLGRSSSSSLVVSAASFVQSRKAPPSPAPRAFLGFGDSLQPARDDPRAFSSVVEHADEPGAALQDEVCRATRAALLGLKPLREASEELRSVGNSLDAASATDVTGGAFSDGALMHRRDLDQFRVLYFATHGLLPKPGGCLPEPSLLTSVDDAIPGSDGLLTVSDILGLKLDADLVVLSACDTGGSVTGELDRSGLGGAAEALGGLTRAFIYAGARSLIVSHWQVDSAATVKLMTGMFAEHSPSLGEAMRASQLQLMDSPDQYSHPYYWAAFTIVGDAARPMPAR